MDTWETIRLRCVRDREPVKTVARELGLSKNTVKKYIRSLQAPQYQSPKRTLRLDAYRYHIDNLIRRSPKITAVRIGNQLARSSIRSRNQRTHAAPVRCQSPARDRRQRSLRASALCPRRSMQFDFTPVKLVVAGVLTVVHLFVARLSYSGRIFARVSLREDQVALFAGLLGAVVHFGGVPRVGVFDNAKTAVTRILRGRNREENEAFRAFCGGLALEVEFAAPAKGNEKGGVEGANGFVEDNMFRPIPDARISRCSTSRSNNSPGAMRRAGRRCIAKPSASGSLVNDPAFDRSQHHFRPPAFAGLHASTSSPKRSAIPTATRCRPRRHTAMWCTRALRGARSRHHRRAA